MTDTAAHSAAERAVARCRDDPERRYRLAAEFYDRPGGRGNIQAYARPMLRFIRWQIDRGALRSPRASPPGSPWWRAVNETLLCDAAEAAHPQADAEPSNERVVRWRRFLADPSPARWFAAHNAGVVAGYLDHEQLAHREGRAERFVLNVTLVRLLYAQVLASDDRLALGYLAPLGHLLSHPRTGLVERFIMVPRAYPRHYPCPGTADEHLVAEQWFARLLDLGVIAPRLGAVYEHTATTLGMPELLDLVADGVPCYAWDRGDAAPWRPPTGSTVPSAFARATGWIGNRSPGPF